MSHLQFKLGLCHAFLDSWATKDSIPWNLVLDKRPLICTSTYSATFICEKTLLSMLQMLFKIDVFEERLLKAMAHETSLSATTKTT